MRAALLLLAVVATGCGGAPDVAAPAPPSATTQPSPTAEPSPTTTPTPSALPQTSRCVNEVQGYALTYPFAWSTGGGPGIEPCRFFDPQPLAVIPAETEVTEVAIRVTVRDVPLEQARRDTPGEQEERTAAGRPAVRVTGTYEDDALLPPGTRFTTWLVDLGSRTFLITADDAARGDHAEAVEVLDAMAASLEVL